MNIYNLALHFDEIANENLNSIALFFYEKNFEITYADLNQKSNRLANFLIEKKLEGLIVAIIGDKTPETFISILATLKSGHAYTIIDPENPNYRLEKIFDVCAPSILIGGKKFYNERSDLFLKFKNIEYIDIYSDEVNSQIKTFSEKLPEKAYSIHGNSPAYIMFTSGSTGTPKGAIMTHRNVLNFISWSKEEFSISKYDIFTNANPLYFDNSVFDIYSSLFTGAKLVPISKEIINNVKKLIELLEETKCSIWFSVPSLLIFLQTMKVFNKDRFKSLKKIIIGGEGYPKAKLKNLFDFYKENTDFYNVYGPTECTCICSSYKISDLDFESLEGFPPIGKLIKNFSGLILDDNLKILENGEVGELYLIGPNVGLGYYNDLQKTDERFISNPYSKYFYEKMYKTGDLVRFNNKDQKIYILGRKDNQIKHMGYRIELEEIENVISKIPYVIQVGVVHSSITGFSKIKAFLELDKNKKYIDINKIKEDVAELLPSYMIPNNIVILEQIPKNQNGKVDRNKLKEL